MEEVTLVFQKEDLIRQYGLRPKAFPKEIAKRYIDRGWARVVERPLDANPSITPNQQAVVPPRPPEPKVVHMPEESYLTSVAWLSNIPPVEEDEKAATKLGFTLEYIPSEQFSVTKAGGKKLLILGSDLSGYRLPQSRQIRVLIFQKQIPYVLRCDSPPKWREDRWLVQAILSSRLLVFTNEDAHEAFLEEYGEIVGLFPTVQTPMEFWKQLRGVVE